jgi:hypothetical protein
VPAIYSTTLVGLGVAYIVRGFIRCTASDGDPNLLTSACTQDGRKMSRNEKLRPSVDPRVGMRSL